MIIFLNGSLNAGKSTIAHLLAKKIPNTALIEIDALREFIEWMPIDQAAPLNIKNAVSIIKNFTKQCLHCIIPYPISEKSFLYIIKELNEFADQLKFYTLAPLEEIASSNRGNRSLNEWEQNRVHHHYQIGIHKPTFGKIIDNSNQTPKETVRIILDDLNISGK